MVFFKPWINCLVMHLVLLLVYPLEAINIPFDVSAYDGHYVEVGTDAKLYVRADNDKIYFAMAGMGSYVAAGLNPSHGEMQGSDIVVCQGSSAKDYHGVGYIMPVLDVSQDWTTIQIGQENGMTFCEISRDRTNCDKNDFQVYHTNEAYAILLAWGTEPNNAGLHYHQANRGVKYMSFIKPITVNSGTVEQLQQMTIIAPDVELPKKDGVDICSYHELPRNFDPVNINYHIVKVKTSWQNTAGGAYALDMAHHITLLYCWDVPDEWEDGKLLPTEGQPNEGNCNMWSKCAELVGQVVNIGADEGVMFPKNTNGFVFLRHFYPKQSTGVYDRGTTYELDYTVDLRPKTLGKLVIQRIDLTIPAQTMDHHVEVLCPSECTQRLNTAITLTSVNIHMHDRGASDARAAIARHIRNGVELKPIVNMTNFIEGTASEGWYPINVRLEPGDEIFFECIYDNPTDIVEIWGSRLEDQMCVLSIATISEGQLPVDGCLDYGPAEHRGEADMRWNNCPSRVDPKQTSQPKFTPAQREAQLAWTPFGENPCSDSPSPSPSPTRSGPDNDTPSPTRNDPNNDTPSPTKSEPNNDTPSPTRSNPNNDSPSTNDTKSIFNPPENPTESFSSGSRTSIALGLFQVVCFVFFVAY